MADPNDVEAAPGGMQTRKSHSDINHEAVQEEAWEPPQNADIKADAAWAVEVEKVVVLSFRGLQLRRIADLQDDLLRLAVTFVDWPTANVSTVNESSASPSTINAAPVSVQEAKTIDHALSAYAEALRNYETLSLNALPRIPVGTRLVGAMDTYRAEHKLQPMQRFLAYIMGGSGLDDAMELWEKLYPKSRAARRYHSDRDRLWRELEKQWDESEVREAVLSGQNGGLAPSQVVNVLEASGGDLGFRELDKQGREQRSKKQAFIQRMIMAMFGGLALIGPMLIMTLHPTRNTSLVTVSIATFLFALALAFIAKDSSGKDVLGATAAYAAVLVVFVGTSMAPAVSG